MWSKLSAKQSVCLGYTGDRNGLNCGPKTPISRLFSPHLRKYYFPLLRFGDIYFLITLSALFLYFYTHFVLYFPVLFILLLSSYLHFPLFSLPTFIYSIFINSIFPLWHWTISPLPCGGVRKGVCMDHRYTVHTHTVCTMFVCTQC